MTMKLTSKTDQEPLEPEVIALVMATLLAMENGEPRGPESRIRIRESWPRTTLWRWL